MGMIEGNGFTKSFLGWQGLGVSLMITSWIPSSPHHTYMKTLTYQNQQTSTLFNTRRNREFPMTVPLFWNHSFHLIRMLMINNYFFVYLPLCVLYIQSHLIQIEFLHPRSQITFNIDIGRHLKRLVYLKSTYMSQ